MCLLQLGHFQPSQFREEAGSLVCGHTNESCWLQLMRRCWPRRPQAAELGRRTAAGPICEQARLIDLHSSVDGPDKDVGCVEAYRAGEAEEGGRHDAHVACTRQRWEGGGRLGTCTRSTNTLASQATAKHIRHHQRKLRHAGAPEHLPLQPSVSPTTRFYTSSRNAAGGARGPCLPCAACHPPPLECSPKYMSAGTSLVMSSLV